MMKRLLFIAHRLPYPPDKGDRVRAFHEIKALSERFSVTVAALAHSRSDRRSAGQLGRHCEQVIVAPAGGRLGLLRGAAAMLSGRSVTEGVFRSPRMARLLGRHVAREPFDLVFGYCSSVLPLVLGVPARARVLDLVDIDSAKWLDYARRAGWPRRWLYGREARAVERLERRAVRQCDAVFLVSLAEMRAMGLQSDKIVAIGNGVDMEYFAPQPPPSARPASLVFTGTMNYRPNVEGVCWFAEHIWPLLRREVAGLEFIIVGRDPDKAVTRLAEMPGIRVTGSVPDVRPYLAAASVVVVPLRIARGIQNKVLEAMATARPVVAAPEALEGLEVSIGRDVLQAQSPRQWLDHILRLLGDERACRQLGNSARQCVEAKYDWSARMAPLVALCERLSEAGKAGGAAP